MNARTANEVKQLLGAAFALISTVLTLGGIALFVGL